MYCKILKLTNGETIMGYTEDNCDNLTEGVLKVVDPVLISSVRIPVNRVIVESYVMQAWLRMAESNVVNIPVRNIIATAGVVEKAEEQYKHFLLEADGNKLTEEEYQELVGNSSREEFLDYADEENEDDEDSGNNSGPILH